jgi:predicted phosphodiesterase
MSRVLVFGDTHIPFIRDGYIKFIKEVYKKYRCDTVVCVGDLFDFHRISRHKPSPEATGAKEEYLAGIKVAKELYNTFPKVKACIGNHDARYYKQAEGYPAVLLKTFEELYQCPKGWDWKLRHIVDDVAYTHGSASRGGDTPHITTARTSRMSSVMGHIHTAAGVQYLAGPNDLIFGMVCGCGMDSSTYAAQYAEEFTKKPIVGCGVVIDGTLAFFVPMPLGNKYDKRKSNKNN